MVSHNDDAREETTVKKITGTISTILAVSIIVVLIIRCGAPPGALLVV